MIYKIYSETIMPSEMESRESTCTCVSEMDNFNPDAIIEMAVKLIILAKFPTNSMNSNLTIYKDIQDRILDGYFRSLNETAEYVQSKEVNNTHTVSNVSFTSQTPDQDFIRRFRLVAEGYCLIPFAVFGVIGNVSGIFYILKKKRRAQFFNMMLLPLLVFDALYTQSELIMSLEEYILTFPNQYVWAYKYFLYPLRRFSMSSSIFMTIALAHERLCSVSRPILQRNSFLSSKNRKNRLLTYLIPLMTAAAVMNVSAFWEIDIVKQECDPTRYTGTISGCITSSSLRANEYYSYYYVGLLRFLVLGVYPFTSLFYLNYKISQTIEPDNFCGNTQTGGAQNTMTRRRTVVEMRTSKILGAITFTFLIFHLPRMVLNAMEFYLLKEFPRDAEFPTYIYITNSLTRLFLVMNMSLNVVYYLYFNMFTKLWLIRRYTWTTTSRK